MTRITEEERYKHEVYIELENLVSEMNYNVSVTIVEGPHDAITLKNLGYENEIMLCSKTSFNGLVDIIVERFSNVVILTDYDEEGKRINKRLEKLFEERGLKIERFYRKIFRKMLKKIKIRTIEGIYSVKRDLIARGL